MERKPQEDFFAACQASQDLSQWPDAAEGESREWLERVAAAVHELLEAHDRLQEIGKHLLGRRNTWTPEEQVRLQQAGLGATRALNALRACYQGAKAAGALPITRASANCVAGPDGAPNAVAGTGLPPGGAPSGISECWPFGRSQRV